jgi:hypothetical protein
MQPSILQDKREKSYKFNLQQFPPIMWHTLQPPKQHSPSADPAGDVARLNAVGRTTAAKLPISRESCLGQATCLQLAGDLHSLQSASCSLPPEAHLSRPFVLLLAKLLLCSMHQSTTLLVKAMPTAQQGSNARQPHKSVSLILQFPL